MDEPFRFTPVYLRVHPPIGCRRTACFTGFSRHHPCDSKGRVEMDRLSDRERNNYLYARAMVGRDLRNIRGSAATNGFGTLRS